MNRDWWKENEGRLQTFSREIASSAAVSSAMLDFLDMNPQLKTTDFLITLPLQ